jgi:hypothetical protein
LAAHPGLEQPHDLAHAWLRESRRALEAQREREGRTIASDRAERLFEACRRLEQELDADRAANGAARWRRRPRWPPALRRRGPRSTGLLR